MKTFTILEHHEKGDDCDGDYWDLEILDENGACIQTYGDTYHDKGSDKALGFIDGVNYANREEIVKVEHKSVADREY